MYNHVYIYIVHAYYLSMYLSIHIYLFFYRSIYILWVYDIWPADCKVYLLDILFAVRVAAWKPAPSRSSPSSWKLTTAWNGTETGRGPQETVWRWEKMGKQMGKCRENHGIHGKTWKPTGKWGKYWKKLGQIRKHLENMWRWCKMIWNELLDWIKKYMVKTESNQNGSIQGKIYNYHTWIFTGFTVDMFLLLLNQFLGLNREIWNATGFARSYCRVLERLNHAYLNLLDL